MVVPVPQLWWTMVKLKVRIAANCLQGSIEICVFLAQEELDPLEMLEATNVLDRLAKDFFEKIVRVIRGYISRPRRFALLGIETMERPKRGLG